MAQGKKFEVAHPPAIKDSGASQDKEKTLSNGYGMGLTRMMLAGCGGVIVLLLIVSFVNNGRNRSMLRSIDNELIVSPWQPHEPPLPGILPGVNRPHIILAQDVDYPPYAYLGSATEEFAVDGFGHDVAVSLNTVCDIDVTVVQTKWGNCWNAAEGIGQGLLNGHFHGCMTYTHTVGVRNRFVDFSEPILDLNKPAGLIVKLDGNSTPLVLGNDDLSGKRVVDVKGWAPTEDGMYFVTNSCTGKKFKDFTIVATNSTLLKSAVATYASTTPVDASGELTNPNDASLLMVLSGGADAMFVYADQAKNYQCDPEVDADGTFDCKLWTDYFGKPNGFAYIHTGWFEYAYGGTTLSLHKKGSGLSSILNPCIEKFRKTKKYYEVCKENKLEDSCYKNEYFPSDGGKAKPAYETPTKDLTSECSSGYCKCMV